MKKILYLGSITPYNVKNCGNALGNWNSSADMSIVMTLNT